MVGYEDIHLQCFEDTESAYQKVRQNGELHIPAFMAALNAFKRHENKAYNASCRVQEYIALTVLLGPERWIQEGLSLQSVNIEDIKGLL